jgi:hypothetical protein
MHGSICVVSFVYWLSNGILVARVYQITFRRATGVMSRSFGEDKQRYSLVSFCYNVSRGTGVLFRPFAEDKQRYSLILFLKLGAVS